MDNVIFSGDARSYIAQSVVGFCVRLQKFCEISFSSILEMSDLADMCVCLFNDMFYLCLAHVTHDEIEKITNALNEFLF